MKIRPYPGNRWQADSGIIAGRRLRQVFETRADARAWLAQMADRRAADKLQMPDIDIKTAQDARRAAELLGGKTSLAEAARFWTENHRESAMRHLKDLTIEFKRDLCIRHARPRYMAGMIDTLNSFIAAIGNRMAGDCTTDAILTWLRNPAWSKATFRNRRRELSVFFNWCVRQGILALNPVARIPSPKLDEHQIDVLTVEQTEKLLNGLQGSDRAYFAIAIFAGLRPGEIDRLIWNDVKLDRGHIDLRGQHSKTGARRLVTIQPNLAAWLSEYFFKDLSSAYPGRRDLIDASDRQHISRCDKYEMMKRATYAAGLDSWPQNICRHSFGSYHLAKWKNANETALEMGHATTAMLFKHYREVVTPEDAERFWAIVPPNQ